MEAPRNAGRRFRRHSAAAAVVVLTLVVAPTGGASDATLKATLAGWSRQIATEARSLQDAARTGQPRLLASSARLFRADALHAGQALAKTDPSTNRGARARRLALAAFAQYGIVGRDWVLTGKARLRNRRTLALRYARLASLHAHRGNTLLLAAGALL
jgi:hypothetical protein